MAMSDAYCCFRDGSPVPPLTHANESEVVNAFSKNIIHLAREVHFLINSLEGRQGTTHFNKEQARCYAERLCTQLASTKVLMYRITSLHDHIAEKDMPHKLSRHTLRATECLMTSPDYPANGLNTCITALRSAFMEGTEIWQEPLSTEKTVAKTRKIVADLNSFEYNLLSHFASADSVPVSQGTDVYVPEAPADVYVPDAPPPTLIAPDTPADPTPPGRTESFLAPHQPTKRSRTDGVASGRTNSFIGAVAASPPLARSHSTLDCDEECEVVPMRIGRTPST